MHSPDLKKHAVTNNLASDCGFGSENGEWVRRGRRLRVGLQTKEWIRADWWWARGWLHWWADFFFFSSSQQYSWTKCLRYQGERKWGRPACGKMSSCLWWLVSAQILTESFHMFPSFACKCAICSLVCKPFVVRHSSRADTMAAAMGGSCHCCDVFFFFFALVWGNESVAHYFFMLREHCAETLWLIILWKCLIDCKRVVVT